MKTRFILATFALMTSSLAYSATPLTSDKIVTLPGKAGKFDFMQVDVTSHRLLAAHKQAGSLTLLDLKSEKLLPSIQTGAAQGLAVDSKNAKYYVGDENEKKIVIINSKTLSKIGEIKVDGPVDAVAFDSKRGMLYADEDNGKNIWVINTKTKKVAETISIPGDPEYIEYGPMSDRIYQNIKSNDTVLVIDPGTNKIESTWSTLPVTSPHGLALDEKRGLIFIAGKNGKLVALDIKTGKNVASVDIGPSVDQITFDSEKGMIYCAGKTGISVVSETDSGIKALGTIPSAEGAHTLAVDPVKHDVWISYADKNNSYLRKFKFNE